VLFAYLRLRSASLAAPVLAHAATNCFAYIGAVVVLHL
jgi:membrane protease YdiL (CAAX protease family)